MRRSHVKHHDRPWKCNVDGCEYSETGFLSRRMRDAHLDQFHTEDQKQQPLQETRTQNLDQNEIQPLLFDLVRADRTMEVKQLLDHFKAMKGSEQGSLLQLAARSASEVMLGMLYDAQTAVWSNIVDLECQYLSLLHFAILSKNPDAVRWILERLDTCFGAVSYYPCSSLHNMLGPHRTDWSIILQLVLESDSEELFQCLIGQFAKEFTAKRQHQSTSPVARALVNAVMKATDRQPERERRLLLLWDKIRQTFSTKNCGQALRCVAETCYSIPLAKALLRYGADINFTGVNTDTYRTPILCALRRSSPEAAEFARFLLYMGADPDRTARKSAFKSAGAEPGGREIYKWLGITWDELVAKVKADREAGICPAEYSLEASDSTTL